MSYLLNKAAICRHPFGNTVSFLVSFEPDSLKKDKRKVMLKSNN